MIRMTDVFQFKNMFHNAPPVHIYLFYVKREKGCLLEARENSIIKPVRLRGKGEKDELSKRTGKADCKA